VEEGIPLAPDQHEPGAAGDELFDPGTVTVAHPAPGLAVVSLRGEHDLSTELRLAEAFEGAGAHSNVVVDLSDCTFMDSTVISALLTASRAARARDEVFAVVIPPERANISRLAEMTRLSEVFPVHTSLAAALVALAPPQPES
jgi:anti-sigma B factor antagonist